jgi:Flp pilus assembly protein TadD
MYDFVSLVLSAAAYRMHCASVKPQVLLYMARAHHDAGDHLSAKRTLLKALHLAPSDIKIRFNLAFVLQVGGCL